MKDLFSAHSKDYARYRPTYPPELFQWLISQLPATNAAWDCGTGNGQVAAVLSKYFTQVYATDISPQQMEQAPKLSNIEYKNVPAEESGLPASNFDVVIVAQAVHWFRFDAFYKEVKRVLKPDGVLALVGYGLMKIDAETDVIIQHLYSQTLAGYWDAERRYLDEGYQTIPFPFSEIHPPDFAMYIQWNLNQLLGYLRTWSAVKHYEKANNIDPIKAVEKQLQPLWKDEVKTVSFPLLLRVGKM
jgi:SAM-dependent methyltransferase